MLCFSFPVFQFFFSYQGLFAVNQKKKVTMQFIFSFCLWTGECGLIIWIMDWFSSSCVKYMTEFGEVVSNYSDIWKLLHSI